MKGLREHFNRDGSPKKPFKTKKAAITFAHKYYLTDMRFYKCSFCGDWHMASEKGTV